VKEIRVCKTCKQQKECYKNHLECCDCYGKKAKIKRMENEHWLMNSREYQRQYYWNNLEKCRAYSKKYWHEQHDAKIAAGLIKPKKKQTQEEFNAHRRAYYQKNIQKMRDNAKRYRERKRLLQPPKPPKPQKNILQIIVETGGKCGDFNCKKCPLNYRESCLPAEIRVEAERLMNEKAIRD
jgi:hypothetical protein